jgi:hypothetical protein
VLGTQGRIDFVLSPYDPGRNAVTVTSASGARPVALRPASVIDPVYPGLMDATRGMISFVLDRVLDGGPEWIDGTAGRAALEIVAAAYASDQRGMKITLPLAVPEAVTSGWVPRHLRDGERRR